MHQGGNLRLYQYAAGSQPRLVWPYMNVRDPTVLGDLIVFNGGESDERVWSYYPAFFGYSGTGKMVELSQPLARRIALHSSGATNYAFEVTASVNEVVNLRASQSPPIDRLRPITLTSVTTKEEILQIIAAAQTNGLAKEYEGISYLIAK